VSVTHLCGLLQIVPAPGVTRDHTFDAYRRTIEGPVEQLTNFRGKRGGTNFQTVRRGVGGWEYPLVAAGGFELA